MTTIGTIIRTCRNKKDLTKPAAARKIGITPGYLNHLENDDPVRFSDKLLEKVVKHLACPAGTLRRLQVTHNRRALRVYKTYPSYNKRAKSSKR